MRRINTLLTLRAENDRPNMTHTTDEKNLELAAWLESASAELKALLCELAGTSESMYRQWVSGRRKLSAAKAGEVEDAMLLISRTYPTAPPALTRGDLCEACHKCPYYKAVQDAADDSEGDSLDILNK